MKLVACGIAGVVAALAALTGATLAQDKRSPIPSHLPLGKEACFGRVYDAAHLMTHPKQRVTAFHLFRDFAVDATAEDPPMSSGIAADADGEHNSVGLMAYVRFRDRLGVYSNWLHCMRDEKGAVRCGVECDGGGFRLRTAGTSLLADNEGFIVTGGCGASGADLTFATHPAAGS